MQEEKIVKGYDPVIMRKLVRFLRPYRAIVVISLAALLGATGAELMQPVVLQRAIDNHIDVVYYRLERAGIGASLAAELRISAADQDIRAVLRALAASI